MITFTDLVTKTIDYAWSEPGASDPRIRSVLSKTAHVDFLKNIGVPHARLRAVLPDGELLDEELLGNSAVLKPNAACSSRGVLLLRKGPRGWSYPGSKTLDITQLRVLLNKPHNLELRPWIVEDLHEPPAGRTTLMEYDVFCFGGAPLVAVGKTHDKYEGSRCFTIPDWEPLDIVRPNRKTNHKLRLPTQPDALTALSNFVATELRLPFSRIDIFDTDKGPVVGEINAWSGDGRKPLWPDDWEKKMGQWWHSAIPRWPYLRPLL